MKEFEKLLLEDTKRRENEKALTEIKLGLFEQKEEETFDFGNYTLITYGKKYKGLYDLYQNTETFELAYVCPLVEDNKGDDNERTDLAPYAYDVIYLELLTGEEFDLVKKAASHEKSNGIHILCNVAIFVTVFIWALALATLTASIISIKEFTSIVLLCGPLFSGAAISTILLPILLIKYRKFKAE